RGSERPSPLLKISATATSPAAILRLRDQEWELPAREATNTMKTMPAIMFRCSESSAKPQRLVRISAMFLRLKLGGAPSVRKDLARIAAPSRKSRELTNRGNRPGPARLKSPMG